MANAQSASSVAFPSRLGIRSRPGARSRVDSGSLAREVLLRGIVWGLIGLIYAPLFIGLLAIWGHLGAGVATYALAAALAGAAGAALYGAREVALIGSGIGVILGVGTLTVLSEVVSFEQAVLLASGVAAAVGLTVVFPGRCTRRVPGKVMAGLSTGALCGAALAVAQPLYGSSLPTFSVLAFLVSVNGVLYVATVRRWVGLASRLGIETRPCNTIEALVIAVLAGIAAGSVWVMAAPLLGEPGELVRYASEAVYRELPAALAGGIVGGAVAGSLLELLGFAWVHDI